MMRSMPSMARPAGEGGDLPGLPERHLPGRSPHQLGAEPRVAGERFHLVQGETAGGGRRVGAGGELRRPAEDGVGVGLGETAGGEGGVDHGRVNFPRWGRGDKALVDPKGLSGLGLSPVY